MRRSGSILVALLALGLLVPEGADAQRGRRPSDNVQTRSAALYLKNAREAGNPEDERRFYEQMLEVSLEGTQRAPENPKTWYMAGVALANLGQYVRADSMLDRAEAIYPDYEEVERERERAWVEAYNAGIVALQQNNVEEALAHMKDADAIFAGRPGARLNLGAIHQRLGQQAEAIAAYRGALEILRGPQRAELNERDEAQWAEWEEVAVFNMAQLLAANQRNDEAEAAYREFLQRDPDNLQARSNLAVVLTRMGKEAEAAQLYEELLSRTDLSAAGLFNIGIGLYNADRFEQAADAFRRSVEQNPYEYHAHYNLAQTLYRLGTQLDEQYEAASGAQREQLRTQLMQINAQLREAADQARALNPFERNALRLLAQAHRRTGDLTTGAESTQARQNAVTALEQIQGITFEVDDVGLGAPADGRVSATVNVTNVTVAEGQPIRFRVVLLGDGGSPVGSQEVTLNAPAAEQRGSTVVEIPVTGDVAGWRIEAVS